MWTSVNLNYFRIWMKLLDNLSNLRQIMKEEEYLRNKDSKLKTKSKDSILGTNMEAYKFRELFT